MDLFWGRYRLWPSLLWLSWSVAVMDLAVMVLHVAVMDIFWGRYCLWPSLLWPSWYRPAADGVHTDENVDTVESQVLSQEHKPQSTEQSEKFHLRRLVHSQRSASHVLQKMARSIGLTD